MRRLALDFRKPKKGDPPGPCIAQVYVASHLGDDRGLKLITAQCVTIEEFKFAIDQLKKELDKVMSEARRKFSLGR